jgi:hypothetical protein
MLLPVSFNLFSSRFLNGALQGGWAWILLGAGLCPQASSRLVYSWDLATFEWLFHLCRLPYKAHSAQFAHEPRGLFRLVSEVVGAPVILLPVWEWGLFPPHSKQPPQVCVNSKITLDVFLSMVSWRQSRDTECSKAPENVPDLEFSSLTRVPYRSCSHQSEKETAY